MTTGKHPDIRKVKEFIRQNLNSKNPSKRLTARKAQEALEYLGIGGVEIEDKDSSDS